MGDSKSLESLSFEGIQEMDNFLGQFSIIEKILFILAILTILMWYRIFQNYLKSLQDTQKDKQGGTKSNQKDIKYQNQASKTRYYEDRQNVNMQFGTQTPKKGISKLLIFALVVLVFYIYIKSPYSQDLIEKIDNMINANNTETIDSKKDYDYFKNLIDSLNTKEEKI